MAHAAIPFAGCTQPHGDLYVRTAAWFRGSCARHEGHIRVGGVDKDLTTVRTRIPGSTLHRS